MEHKHETTGASVADIDTLFEQSFDFSRQLIFFPVRHHSPACALHLEKTIESYQPDCILIEGPADADHLIPVIAHPESVPPFAIYCGFDDKNGLAGVADGKYRAYYPFLRYSPELRAIVRAAQLGIRASFIDIPYAARLVSLKSARTEVYTRYKYNEDAEYEVNTYTSMLAQNAGYRSYAEFWEAFYELRAASTETKDFVRNLFHLSFYMRDAACDMRYATCDMRQDQRLCRTSHIAQSHIANQRKPEDDEDRLENSLREAYMAEQIAPALKSHRRVLVVCGAYHTLGILANLANPPAPVGKAAVPSASAYLMPYTFAEMDGRKGYAAGMPFPAYYEEIWADLSLAKRNSTETFADVARNFIVKAARFVRKTNPVSLPDEINALAMASSLASLRGKLAPGVYELIDGVQAAFVKGDINRSPAAELDYLFRIMSGLGAGKVAAQEQMPPIVLDFRERCREYRVKTDTVIAQECTLDILKNPAHYRKSRFFHQMSYLETGFCHRLSGPDYVTGESKNLVREMWQFKFSSKIEAALIDQSVFGASLAEAAGTLASRQLKDSMSAAQLGKLLIGAEVMGLEGFYERYETEIDDILNREGLFCNAVACLGCLRYLKKLQVLLRGQEDSWLTPLLVRAYRQGVALMDEGRKARAEDERKACGALRSLFNISVESSALSGLSTEDIRLFASRVEAIVNEGFCNSRFYGSLLAIHEKQGRIDTVELGARVKARLESSMNSAEDAASFIAGVFLIGRDVLFGGFEILEALDKVVGAMDDESFLAALPNFRHAFTSFLPSETGRIGGMVAQLYGLSGETIRVAEQVSSDQLALGMRLDRKAATALDVWALNPVEICDMRNETRQQATYDRHCELAKQQLNSPACETRRAIFPLAQWWRNFARTARAPAS
jgi:hypothetical protein